MKREETHPKCFMLKNVRILNKINQNFLHPILGVTIVITNVATISSRILSGYLRGMNLKISLTTSHPTPMFLRNL